MNRANVAFVFKLLLLWHYRIYPETKPFFTYILSTVISFPRIGTIDQKVCKNNSNEMNSRFTKWQQMDKIRRDTWWELF